MTAASILLKVTVIMALALAGTRLARNGRAAVRHVLLAGSFAVLLILPIASFVAPTVQIAMPAAVQDALAPLDTEPIIETATTTRLSDGTTTLQRSSTWLSLSVVLTGVWLAGTVVFLFPVILGLWQVRSLRRSALPWRGGDAIAADAGIGRRVDVLLHESLAGPMTCGVLRPAIVLPGDATSWGGEDLRRAIVHELAHVRRCDWISQILARVVASIYWFHPIVWVAWRQLSLEAERACDDAVLLSGPDPSVAYADQLVGLAQRLSNTSKQPHLAMANRSDLATRVIAVLDNGQRRGRAGAAWVGVAAVACAMLVITISPLRLVAANLAPGIQAPASQVAGPSGKVQRYDAASIKPCEAEENPTGARGTAGGTNAATSPGRFYVPCVTTEQLIYLAYAAYGVGPTEHLINDNSGNASDATKVRGGPDWVHSLKVKYSIEATAAGVTDRLVLMGAMLRTLLEERFKLKTHRDVEEAPMYSLTVGKGGFKLKPMNEGDCEPFDPSAPFELRPVKPKCSSLNMDFVEGKTVWTFGGFDMSNFAGRLTSALKIHVIDNTNIKDKFVFVFRFPRDPDPLITETGIFAAVEEQLGLKLEKTKGPRGFLVIDSIERPTPDDSLEPMPSRARGAGGQKP